MYAVLASYYRPKVDVDVVTAHHGLLVDHSRSPADVSTFIHHSYKQSVWVCVDPVGRCALWVTHPDAGPVSNVSAELSQRTAVQPEGGRHRESMIHRVLMYITESNVCEGDTQCLGYWLLAEHVEIKSN